MNLNVIGNADGGALFSPTSISAPSITTTTRPKQQASGRRYAFACSNCRRKKVRCGGEKPICRNCSSSGKLKDSCAYRQQKTLENELQQAQEEIRALHEQLNETRKDVTKTPRSMDREDEPEMRGGLSGEQSAEGETSEEGADIFWSQVSVDNEGSPTYHGSTSRFHLEIGRSDAKRRPSSSKGIPGSLTTSHVKSLQANAELLKRVWEPLAYAGFKSFFRDLALGGPYFSEFLLMSIYALAARHADQVDIQIARLERGEKCLQRAKVLLINELSESKPKIPTIQGLLILGGRQCAVGNSSEGWLYTGMAIRMIKDIGLHLNSNSLQAFDGFQPAELESRKRLFFSAYIWDKSISLCLGRPPTLVEIPHSVDDMLDQFVDADPWAPVCLAGMEGYPPTPGYNTSTFKEFCRIGEIVSLMYSAIYNDSKARCGEEEAEAIEAKLHLWFTQLPASLRIDDAETMQYCPPPHILSLNLVYYTLLILVWRPFLTASASPQHEKRAREICTSQSVKINNLFLLYGRTFNYNAMTYLVSYSVYTAATINVYDMKNAEDSNREEVAGRLNISLQILESEARQTPGVRRSVDIIKRMLSTWDTTPRGTHKAAKHKQQQGTTHADTINADNKTYTYGKTASPGAGAGNHQSAVSVSGASGSAIVDDLDRIMYELPVIDAGGGFQPDAYHWSLNDTWSWNAGQDFSV